MVRFKLLFCVLDGAADRPCKALGGRTPFEIARKPALDYIAQEAATGLVEVIPGVAPESDAAVLSLLGYDPRKHYVGRGVFEALGAGMPFKEGILALRANFATSHGERRIIDRRVGRSLTSKEAKELEKALNKIRLPGFEAVFKATVQHRGVLMLKRLKGVLSPEISNTDPAYEVSKGIAFSAAKEEFKPFVQDCRPLASNTAASTAAEAVNEWWRKAHRVLEAHPLNKKRRGKGLLAANAILLRDAGTKYPRLKPLPGKWAIVADMPLEIGIAYAAKMKAVGVPTPTFTYKDYPSRLRACLQALKKYDAAYVHLKGPDLFGHDGDAIRKMKSIEEIDEGFFKPLLKKINLRDTVVAVTSDHTTSCDAMAHTADPVPLAVAGGLIQSDATQEFSERACAEGVFGKLRGTQVMPLLLELAGLRKK